MTPILSIIVPFYQVERYLGRCLDSLVDQDVPDGGYEVVLVNDGSTDGSLAIAEEYAAKHPFIKVLSQENQGQGAARNHGIMEARGRYVWFVDSDDWIAGGCVPMIIRELQSRALDALYIKAARVIGDEVIHRPDHPTDGSVMTGSEYVRRYGLNCCAVLTIIRRGLLLDNDLHFTPGLFHEDLEFWPRVYRFIERHAVFNSEVYYNLLREGSTMTSVNPKKGFDLIKVACSLAEAAEGAGSAYRPAYNDFVAMALDSAVKVAASMTPADRAGFMEEWNGHRYLLRSMRNASRPKNRLEGVLLTVAPRLMIKLFPYR